MADSRASVACRSFALASTGGARVARQPARPPRERSPRLIWSGAPSTGRAIGSRHVCHFGVPKPHSAARDCIVSARPFCVRVSRPLACQSRLAIFPMRTTSSDGGASGTDCPQPCALFDLEVEPRAVADRRSRRRRRCHLVWTGRSAQPRLIQSVRSLGAPASASSSDPACLQSTGTDFDG